MSWKKASFAGFCAALLGGCADRVAAPAAPASAPVTAPAVEAPPPAAPPPRPVSWEDQATAPGDWRYAAAQADYGEAGAAAFVVRCDPAQARILLSRAGAAAGTPLTLRTTFGSRTLTVAEGGVAALPVGDPFLDDMLFSRGRIAVEAPGLPALVLPAWPEPARAVEECRP